MDQPGFISRKTESAESALSALSGETRAELRARLESGEAIGSVQAWLKTIPGGAPFVPFLLQAQSQFEHAEAIARAILKRRPSKAARRPRGPRPRTAAELAQLTHRNAFTRAYGQRPPVTAEAVFADAQALYGYEVGESFERRRNAILAAACCEYERERGQIPTIHFLDLIARRYSGLAIGQRRVGRPGNFHISRATLRRALQKWKQAPVKTPDALAWHLLGRVGRKRKQSGQTGSGGTAKGTLANASGSISTQPREALP